MCDVMILDGDQLILVTLSEALRDEGFLVESASSADEAIGRMRLPAPPRLLVIDIDLNQGDVGRHVAEAAALASPRILVLFTTGQPASLPPALPGKGGRVLKKPFLPSFLAEVMREMMTA